MDTKRGECIKTDYLIIGSGIAGLRASLELGKRGHAVALITKRKLADSNTYYAQGGIAAVPMQEGKPLPADSFEDHIKDTLASGKGLSDRNVVASFVENAYTEVISPLLEWGVPFTHAKKKGAYPYSLHQEGGHSTARIFHVADYSGRAVEEALIAAVRKMKNVVIYEHHMAINLITRARIIEGSQDACLGAYVYDTMKDTVHAFSAKATFLATGGAGRAYLFTTNSSVETGDGIAMAYRAGLPIANMEFFQFHPTVLYGYDNQGQSFLLTEALRGKKMGGILTLSKDSTEDFVKQYHPDGSSGTRDIVAQAIDSEMKKRGLDHVWLNVTTAVSGKSSEEIKEGFPDIYAKCKELGIDITKDPIPTVPAAHYTIGGVLVGSQGETELPGLYAIGEVSYTGLHGANRLASNSLPEAALFGKRAVEHALASSYPSVGELPAWDVGTAVKSSDEVQVAHNWDEVRRIMWHLVGIVRSGERLEMAKRRLDLIRKETFDYYWNYHISPDLLELRNITDVASLIVDSALSRKESRGGHFRLDYPKENPVYAKITVLR